MTLTFKKKGKGHSTLHLNHDIPQSQIVDFDVFTPFDLVGQGQDY